MQLIEDSKLEERAPAACTTATWERSAWQQFLRKRSDGQVWGIGGSRANIELATC